MTYTPLRMWGQGAVTLPKKWRDQFNTKNFMAVETKKGLLIQPVKEAEVEYYEDGPHRFGLHFPNGIDAKELYDRMKLASDQLDREEKTRIRKRRTHGSH